MASPPGPQTLQPSPDQIAHWKDDRSPRILGISIMLITLSTTVVAARFYARRLRKLPLQADDWLIIPALILTVILCAINIIAIRFGNGKHIYTMPLTRSDNFLKMAYVLSITYSCVHFFIKMSLLLLYRRIFTTFDRTFRIALYVIMAYITGWSISALFVCIFACSPISFYWEQAFILVEGPVIPGKCINIVAAESGIGILNAIADLSILSLPMMSVWRLKMDTYRRIGLSAVFSLGAFACAVSIIRVIVVYQETLDFTWGDSDLFLWTAIEPAVGILCACFPIITPAFTGPIFRQRFGNTLLGQYIQKIFGVQESTDPSIPAHNMRMNRWSGSKTKPSNGSSTTSLKPKKADHVFGDRSWDPLDGTTSSSDDHELQVRRQGKAHEIGAERVFFDKTDVERKG